MCVCVCVCVCVSRSVVSDSAIPQTVALQAPHPWDSPGKNTRVGSHSLLQGIFSTQGSNPGLPHCRQMLYRLSHQGSPVSNSCDPMDCSLPGSSVNGVLQPRILEWVPFPSPGDLPDTGIEPGSPALQADSFSTEP